MEKRMWLTGATLIDGSGGEPLENSGVFIEGKKITYAGPASNFVVPEGTEVIELHGKTIMPGMIDAHVHIHGPKSLNMAQVALEPSEMQMGRALQDLPKLIQAGFTTVRDVGSHVAVYIRDLMKEGIVKGPRIKTSRHMLSQTGGHADIHMLPSEMNIFTTCDGVDECIKTARTQFREGADFLKVCSTGGVLSEKDDPRWSQFRLDELKAIVYEAESVQSYVAAHAQGTQGIINALMAGVKTIEHGIYIDERGIELMLQQKAVLVPTLSIVHRIIQEGHKFGVPEFGIRKAQLVYQEHIEHMITAHKAGVVIASGTDFCSCAPVEHGGNALELELLVNDVGFTPMEAIVAATRSAAAAMQMSEQIGTIEAGKLADIIVLGVNPLSDIRLLQTNSNIEQVYLEGERLK
ncbi:imidazolonepropionase-like amidohydrolase [Paenibacillus sp. JGP012]|uniref:metal-dependent hydrolase family protein n=1 Tax=Paenibacillus sp. JGP012 TaxID=2735914 RepID=UPI0016093745|nr:amidohydrolase family protein [Paenibacillus sp. JGP012]MBB6023216.1 imidazolonepropionase-like amidohydrolase [Paenibacillus sp. JGP012]